MTGIDNIAYVKPTYNIYQLGSIFKVVKFKNTLVTLSSSIDKLTRSECNHYDNKLAASLSRTRKLLLEKALCNPWDWFCTFTLDKEKYKRDDLPKFQKDFTQFIRDERKRGFSLSYILVPELHEDLQNWHIHGFLYGDPGLITFKEYRQLGHKVPSRLVRDGFYTWPRYQEKFGFCSLGRIRSHVRSAFYISKYMSKDNARLVSSLGSKMYYTSQGLNTAVKHGEIYGNSSYMDKFLERDYEFCQVGMTRLSDRLNWTFGLDFMDIPLNMFEPVFEEIQPSRGFWDDMSTLQWEQMNLYNTDRDCL